MKINEVCLVEMVFRYPMAVSEDDSDAHVREVYILEVDELVTEYPSRKPLLDPRKKPIGEDAGQNNFRLVEAVGSPTRCWFRAQRGRSSGVIFCRHHWSEVSITGSALSLSSAERRADVSQSRDASGRSCRADLWYSLGSTRRRCSAVNIG